MNESNYGNIESFGALLSEDIVKAPENDRALITQCVFKTKREAKGDFKRLKTILVASRNEKRFG